MPGIPHQNGAAERKNHTFMNMVRSMLRSNELPLFLWSKTLNTIMYILNRISSEVVRKTQDQDNTSMNKDTLVIPQVYQTPDILEEQSIQELSPQEEQVIIEPKV